MRVPSVPILRHEAIDAAIANMDTGICASCPFFAFRECADLKTRGVLETAETRKE